jgi:glyoxylase-like metal-dependent hydrolase (beta-lactamase superfamily II)/rhodanese-related sulfurtransferase
LIKITAIETKSLGDRGYLVTDGEIALVIDPQRDFDRVLDLAAARGAAITGVFETHVHNDYVTGGYALARATGAAYYLNAADQVAFERTPVADGDVIKAGTMRLRALATPGHTFTHLCYALADGDGTVLAVFTGGSLLFGSTGRTDLLGAEHQAELARAQYRSARRLAGELPDSASVWPTHGFGSFCSATQTTGTSSTIGEQKRANPALTLAEADFVEATLAGLEAYPAYYAHMGPANAAGPAAPDLSPPRRADAAELRRRIDAGEWVVDLRSRRAFAAGHLRGALSFELGDSFATYLGWLIPWGTPLTVIGSSAADVAAAQRELVRIGIDKLAAAADGPAGAWSGGEALSSFEVTDFEGLDRIRGQGGVVVLDVRRDSEWAESRVDGAVHIPLHELPARIGELPAGRIWVHCQSGYRAAVAASLLDAAGLPVVLVDGELDRAELAGLARPAPGAVVPHVSPRYPAPRRPAPRQRRESDGPARHSP